MLNFLATNYIIQSPYHQGTHSQIKGSDKSKFYKLETFKTDSLNFYKLNIYKFYNKSANTLIKRIHNERFFWDEPL